MVRNLFLSGLLAWVLPITAWANLLQPSQRAEDFEQLVTWIRNDYGPLELKRKMLGFDFAGVTQKYRDQISKSGSDEEYKFLLTRYVGEFRDSHFSLRYPSKQIANLGFTTDLVDNFVVLESIDRNLLSVREFPFERGDVIQLWDKFQPLDVARELSRNLSVSYDPTGLRAGVFYLATRKASRLPLPTGSVTLSILHRATGISETVTLNWSMSKLEPKTNPILPLGLTDMCNEKSRIQPPSSAQTISGVPFTAFSFESPKGRIGFIRIPHFYPINDKGEEVAKERFEQYQMVIEEFERTTKGLIIDQDFNCGGSVVFVNKMFSLFFDRPFQPASFAFRASGSQVSGLKNQLNKFNPSDDGYFEFSEVIAEIEKARAQGKNMTKPLPMRGFMEVKLDMPGGNSIQPNPIRYSKPIVLLINEMSGSGGDLFPALMKDFGRAKLLGTRTMGAGGHLWDDPHLQLKNSRGEINLTRSLIYRHNGQPIENLGVEPHEKYQISMDDFLNGYSYYLKAAMDRL